MKQIISCLALAAALSVAAKGAAAQPYEYPGEYAQRFDGVEAAPRPKQERHAMELDGVAGGWIWPAPSARTKSAPGGQYNSEQLSRSTLREGTKPAVRVKKVDSFTIKQKISESEGDVDRPYVTGPLWNPQPK